MTLEVHLIKGTWFVAGTQLNITPLSKVMQFIKKTKTQPKTTGIFAPSDKTLLVDKNEVTIGSEEINDIALDGKIDKQHCLLYKNKQKWMLKVTSKKGLILRKKALIRGQTIGEGIITSEGTPNVIRPQDKETEIQDGDVLDFIDVQLLIRITD